MTNIDLSGLRDIHIPTHDVDIFPLAIGWWILIFLPFFIYMAMKTFIYLRRQGTKYYAKKEVENITNSDISFPEKLIKLSILMKRLAIKKYGSSKIADLYGQNWANFIKEKSKIDDDKTCFSIASASYIHPDRLLNTQIDDARKIVLSFIRYNI